jgi:hypothetical protein
MGTYVARPRPGLAEQGCTTRTSRRELSSGYIGLGGLDTAVYLLAALLGALVGAPSH